VKKIELTIAGLNYSQTQSNSFALVLSEVHGNRRLPIVIGYSEAQAIALELEKMKPARPLTHDLFHNFAKAFNIRLQEVIISKYHEGIFYSTLICDNGKLFLEIDSRTSDAVALAIRFHCPIFTIEEVMSAAGILFSEDDEAEEKNKGKQSDNELKLELQPDQESTEYEMFTLEELETELAKAIEEEDYEKASVIRDELNQRKKSKP
jgi:bifunctional DNase/RNase